jgi:hypothetical protein
MTAAPEPEQDQAERAAMRGRFAVFPQDKGVIVAYTAGLCSTCLACGCGEAQEPLDLTPGGVMGMMGKLKGLKGMIRL